MDSVSHYKFNKTNKYIKKDNFVSYSKESNNIFNEYGTKIEYSNVVAVIPAYNEGYGIGSVVLQTKKYIKMVIVIDDGSLDNTAEIAQLAGAEVIRLERNLGKATAIMYGFDLALQLGYSAVIMMDGDGQHNPDEIPHIIKPVLRGEADLVIGSRYISDRIQTPLYRKIGRKVLDAFTNVNSINNGYIASDSQSGYRALSLKAMKNLNFRSEDYSFESDMIDHFNERNLVIKEVPIRAIYDVPNKHKKNPVLHGFGVFSNLISTIAYKKPLFVFGTLGLLSITTSIIAWYNAMLIYQNTAYIHYFTTIFSVLMFILGLMLIFSSLILNTIAQIIKRYIAS